MNVATNMLLLQVVSSQPYRTSSPRSVYSGEALSFGGGQSKMPDPLGEQVLIFLVVAAMLTGALLGIYLC